MCLCILRMTIRICRNQCEIHERNIMCVFNICIRKYYSSAPFVRRFSSETLIKCEREWLGLVSIISGWFIQWIRNTSVNTSSSSCCHHHGMRLHQFFSLTKLLAATVGLHSDKSVISKCDVFIFWVNWNSGFYMIQLILGPKICMQNVEIG